jgi:hypothetical protein
MLRGPWARLSMDTERRPLYNARGMTQDEITVARGRKVFFLHPHSVLTEDLLVDILSHEYEIYCVKGAAVAAKAAAEWPQSIMFVNLDEAYSEPQWEAWIKGLLADPSTAGMRLGILTYNPNPDLARKYLMELMLPCGFIQLKLGVVEAKKIILKTLEANEARGRRRYVRARCAGSSSATFNVAIGSSLMQGEVLDLSAAGMAFQFEATFDLTPGTPLNDVQLRLKGSLCRISGTFVGTVSGDPGRNLLMFRAPLPEETTDKIHRFIYLALQEEMAEFVRGQAG